MGSTKIREVWGSNFDAEIVFFNQCLYRFNVLSVDTEFPDFLRNTQRNASEYVSYQDLKFNVEQMKLIYLGITLSDTVGNICATWEFNFSDFDLNRDPHVEATIDLLTSNGLDFEKIRSDGIESEVFVDNFLKILARHRNLKWVTFHGLYDLAYIVKLLSNNLLPENVSNFVKLAYGYFGNVYDIKFMARFCDDLMGGEIGLNRIAKILNVERFGDEHNAGSDSMLTATVFGKMKKIYRIQEGIVVGFLYGISARIQPLLQRKVVVPLHCQPCIPLPPPKIFYCGRTISSSTLLPCSSRAVT